MAQHACGHGSMLADVAACLRLSPLVLSFSAAFLLYEHSAFSAAFLLTILKPCTLTLTNSSILSGDQPCNRNIASSSGEDALEWESSNGWIYAHYTAVQPFELNASLGPALLNWTKLLLTMCKMTSMHITLYVGLVVNTIECLPCDVIVDAYVGQHSLNPKSVNELNGQCISKTSYCNYPVLSKIW